MVLLGPIVKKCSLKALEISLDRVTDKDVIYFHILYYLVVLTTKHEVVNSFPSSSSISLGLNKTIVITGCLSGFHFIVDSISELSVIVSVLRILCFYRFSFSSISTAHTFLQGWINPGCFVQFSTSSSKRSLWVNSAQIFCFPVRPYQIWIFRFTERPVMLRDFISKIFT